MVDRDRLRQAVEQGQIEWRRHALERMAEKQISRSVILGIILAGEVIEDYPTDKPFPSFLMLGLSGHEPYHVVVAFDDQSGHCFVITAYRPDEEHFESDHRTRRSRGKK